ncbi:hypothetical protein PQI66_10110 [Corynebacterium sp. USCH3]|uniref:hypothetical protein n=1 Tax=Corynebacterium sp. USCH3 TaxID=3024840 RepID=UPI00309C7219
MAKSVKKKNVTTRRTFLIGGITGAGVLGAAAVGGGVLLRNRDDSPSDLPAPVDPGPLQLQVGGDGHPGRVTVVTTAGRPLVHFDGYRLTSSVGTRGADVDDPGDGRPGSGPVRVEFEVTDPDYTASVTYRADGGRVTADWEFTTPGDGLDDAGDPLLRGGRIYRTLVDTRTDTELHVPASRWVRDDRGGVPVQERVAELNFVEWDVPGSTNGGSDSGDGGDGTARRLYGCITTAAGTSRSNTMLQAAPTLDGDGTWRCHLEFRADTTVGSARRLVDDGRTLLAGAVLGTTGLPDPTVDVTTSSTYNVFTDGGAQTFTVGLAGYSGRSTTVVGVVARDFDGTEIHRSDHEVRIPQDADHVDTEVTIDLPGPRSWCSVEVTGADSFARTAAAVWPDHEFGPADRSIIGLGGFASTTTDGGSQSPGLESSAAERTLWRRLGVRHLRNPWLTAAESADLGISTAIQPSGAPGKFDDASGGGSFTEWAGSALDRGEDAGVAHYELLNEWDLSDGDTVKLATEYTDRWLVPFRAEMDRRGTDATLLAMPLAGWDAGFLDTIRDRDGWDLLDGIAEHAGRGNYVVDYDGGQWNFLGQVRTARAYLDGHATSADSPTELWLTETYACTRPNAWWYDDERTAADSVLLTLMLAKAEGVTGVHWYQLADGLWYDKYGVDPAQAEYHYGLLHVDRSPKPSLPAFAFAAEMLDGATFLGWIESPHPDLRGLRFSRGDGAVFWVLWSRQDGYLTNVTHGSDSYFPHPEAWIPPDGASLQVAVPGATSCRDVLGRDLPLDDGTATVTGSPVVVTGDIDADLAGPRDVDGEMSVDLTGVSVRRGDAPGTLVVSGVNGTGGRLGLRVTGRQVRGEVGETTLTVARGEFSETVDLGDALPDDSESPSATAVGAREGRPQVRVMAQRRQKVTPHAAESQAYRAEYYRTV